MKITPRIKAPITARHDNTGRTRRRRGAVPRLEALEERTLLSATFSTLADVTLAGFDLGFTRGPNNILYVTDGGVPLVTSGRIYEILPGSGRAIPLVTFSSTTGRHLDTPVIVDSAGNLYGTTTDGGTHGDGSVFEIPRGTAVIHTLVSFDGSDGSSPEDLTIDAAGNLFGTTFLGGTNNTGIVFKVVKNSSVPTLLGSFAAGDSGGGGLVLDSAGDVFGFVAGNTSATNGYIFEIPTSTHILTPLASFNGTDGTTPLSLVLASDGTLYGNTHEGGAHGGGTVFSIAPGSGTITDVADFRDGVFPSNVAVDSSGNIFGGTEFDGSTKLGTVYEIPHGSHSMYTIFTFSRGPTGVDPLQTAFDPRGDIDGVSFLSSGSGTTSTDVFYQLTNISISSLPTIGSVAVTPTTLAGWAVDTNDTDVSIRIRYSIDNNAPVFATASNARPDLAHLFSDTDHGYSIALPALTAGAHTISVYGENPVSKALTFLGSKTIVIVPPGGTHLPHGSLDIASATRIAGWVYDADAASGQIEARVDIDGVTGTPFATTIVRGDLTKTFGSGALGFDMRNLTLSPGAHRIDLYAIDSPTGTPILIASREIGDALNFGQVLGINATGVAGWAYSQGAANNQATIRIDVDGRHGQPFLANKASPTIAHPLGASLGFSALLPAASAGRHTFDIYIIDPATGQSILLKTAVITVP